MKHTDFYSLVEKIKQQEYDELMAAVKAHGGCYKWDDDSEKPIIAVNVDSCCPNPTDIEVCSVSTDGGLKIDGVDKTEGYPVEFQAGDVFAGHLSYIIDYLPEINSVGDVSINTGATIKEPVVNPWRCEACGSLNVEQKIWVDSNTGTPTAQDSVDSNECWCQDCEDHTSQVQESELIDTINDWFKNHLDPDDPEVISGLSPSDYATEEAYDQVCNDHWELLSSEEKISIWKSLNHDKLCNENC